MAIDNSEKRKSAAALYHFLGVGVTPNSSKDNEWRQEAGWMYSGISTLVIDTSVTIEVFVAPDDLSVTVPLESMEYTTWYDTVNLVDQNGDQLVDQNGNALVITVAHTESVYVVYVPPDDLSVVVPEEV